MVNEVKGEVVEMTVGAGVAVWGLGMDVGRGGRGLGVEDGSRVGVDNGGVDVAKGGSRVGLEIKPNPNKGMVTAQQEIPRKRTKIIIKNRCMHIL